MKYGLQKEQEAQRWYINEDLVLVVQFMDRYLSVYFSIASGTVCGESQWDSGKSLVAFDP